MSPRQFQCHVGHYVDAMVAYKSRITNSDLRGHSTERLMGQMKLLQSHLKHSESQRKASEQLNKQSVHVSRKAHIT